MGVLFAAASLPSISFRDLPPISVRDFYDLLELNFSTRQMDVLKSLRRVIDIKNILSIQTGAFFDKRGNFFENGLKLSLLNHENLPPYILNFLEKYKDETSLIKYFPKLYALFFCKEIGNGGIAAEFLTFERNLNLILFGYIGKKRSIDLQSYLNYEDLSDPLVSYIIRQSKNTGPFIFPYKYKKLEKNILDSGADPMKQQLSIESYRFNYYLDIVNSNNISFIGICAYMMCLLILDDKGSLSEQKGREVLKELVEGEYEQYNR